MFSHIMLGTNNLSESIRFYDQVMPILGYSRESTGEAFAGYGNKDDIPTGVNCLWIGTPFNGKPASPGNGVNVSLLATTRDQVNNFYEVALKSGGIEEGAPGIREEVHPNFYATYVRDPAGNKIVVVCHAEQTT
jgi:catechol 2,3-dioxygenase-like lactoylglutathione lyase family enzyme